MYADPRVVLAVPVVPDVAEPGGDAIIVYAAMRRQSVSLTPVIWCDRDVLGREPIPVDARGERRLDCCDGKVRLVPAVPAGALRGVHSWVSVQGVSVSGNCDKFLMRDNHSGRCLDT